MKNMNKCVLIVVLLTIIARFCSCGRENTEHTELPPSQQNDFSEEEVTSQTDLDTSAEEETTNDMTTDYEETTDLVQSTAEPDSNDNGWTHDY